MHERYSSGRRARGIDAVGVLAFLMACGGLGGCMSDDAVERELRADAAAIQADKAQIDIDLKEGKTTALERDQHKLYVDTEKQEHDRGTEDDEFAEGD